MEYSSTLSLVVWSSLLFPAALGLIFLLSRKDPGNGKRKPRGPPGLPIFGNIFDLGTMPHQNLYKLRLKYGPVLWLKLGSVNTMVIQSDKAATELFKRHDHVFCGRKCPVAFTAHNYNQGSLAFGQFGAYWRVLRRLCSMQLFINKKINETSHLRQKCIDSMLQDVEENAAAQARGEPGEVNLPHFLLLMAFNLIGNLTLSRDLVNSESKEGREFFAAMDVVMKWGGKPNLEDFLPFLQRLDPQRIKRNMERDVGRAMKVVSGFVEERVEDQKSTKEKIGDFLDETTSSTLEWAMTELLRNPECMRKTKEELDRAIGNRKVEETDIDELPYLKAVLKETLRLHPPVPFLLPRNAMQDAEFMGYSIPKDTQVFVNAWAIGRDPDYWEDPMSFKPERFIGSNIDYKGQNFGLIPFGSGRRICVGISLADRVMHLAFASMLHRYDWELGQNVTPETIDMNERVGLTLRKLMPLKVKPKKRVM